jgi:Phosphodiester glycosidase
VSSLCRTLLAIGIITLVTLSTYPAQAFTITQSQDSHPFVGVTYRRFRGTIPRHGVKQPLRMYAMVIDLNAPGLDLGVTVPNPDGTTTPEATLNYAQRVGAQISINANFFRLNLPYLTSSVLGRAASRGRVYGSGAGGTQGGINFSPTRQPNLWLPVEDQHPHPAFFNTVMGNMVLIQDGKIINASAFDKGLFARTAMGVTKDNHLILFVVDDPDNGTHQSSGLNHLELAKILQQEFKVTYAINLDGGDSTQMVLCNPTCAYANSPSRFRVGIFSGIRTVGNNFGVFAKPHAKPPEQVPVVPEFFGTLLGIPLGILLGVGFAARRQLHKLFCRIESRD